MQNLYKCLLTCYQMSLLEAAECTFCMFTYVHVYDNVVVSV